MLNFKKKKKEREKTHSAFIITKSILTKILI